MWGEVGNQHNGPVNVPLLYFLLSWAPQGSALAKPCDVGCDYTKGDCNVLTGKCTCYGASLGTYPDGSTKCNNSADSEHVPIVDESSHIYW